MSFQQIQLVHLIAQYGQYSNGYNSKAILERERGKKTTFYSARLLGIFPPEFPWLPQ